MGSLTPSARPNPCTKVVLPAPSSPTSKTRSPCSTSAAIFDATSCVSRADEVESWITSVGCYRLPFVHRGVNMGKLDGRVAGGTGGGRGIGRAIALAVASEGAKIVVSSLTAADLEAGVAAPVAARSDVPAMVAHA